MTQRQTQRTDVLVIGGGVVGASTAIALREDRVSVALIEAGALGTPRGSSAGAARIHVPAAFPDATYLRWGLEAERRWREIESAAGRRLLHREGVLSFGSFAMEQMPALEAEGAKFEQLDRGEVVRRFGVDLPEEAPIIFQPSAGVIDAAGCHEALRQLAAGAGVRLSEREAAEDLMDRGDELVVKTSAGSWSCSAVVVAAGPWSRGLLEAFGASRELAATSQTVLYLRPSDPGRRSGPALIDYEGEEPYCLWEPSGRLKLGFHARGPVVDPDDPREPDAATAERLKAWARERYPDLTLGGAAAETCLYTNTVDDHFQLEREGRVVVAAACNGQGFQLAPVSGALAAQSALEALGIRRARAA